MGTRVPVSILIDYLLGGYDTLNSFLYQYPSVSREQAVRFLELATELEPREAGRQKED